MFPAPGRRTAEDLDRFRPQYFLFKAERIGHQTNGISSQLDWKCVHATLPFLYPN